MLKVHADKMTLQEQVDYIGERLNMQGQRCYDSTVKSCAYGNGKGHHCAVGWLLDTTNISLMQSEGGVVYLSEYYFKLIPENIINNNELFSALQYLHDSSYSKENLSERLKDFKVRFPKITLNHHWHSFLEKAEKAENTTIEECMYD